MLNFVFWNAQGNKGKSKHKAKAARHVPEENEGSRVTPNLIAELAEQLDAHFVVVCEPVATSQEVLQSLNRSSKGKGISFSVPRGPVTLTREPKIQLFTRFGRMVSPLREQERTYIYSVRLPTISFLLACVHLESLAYADENEVGPGAREAFSDISRHEQDHSLPSVVLGDFNMNPFDSLLVAADSFHGVGCARIASGPIKYNREKTRSYPYYYNPSWNLFGDANAAPGTYFLRGKGGVYWNVLDQLMLRPSLIPSYMSKSLRVVTKIGGTDLIGSDGRPQVSDHLPITFSITEGIQNTNV